MSMEGINNAGVAFTEKERRASAPTLATLPVGVAGLLWKNLTPAEADKLGVSCSGACSAGQEIEATTKNNLHRDAEIFFTYAENNFQTDVSAYKQRIAALIDKFTLPKETMIREKIHAELLQLFLSLNEADLIKTEGIDSLPLCRLKEGIVSFLGIALTVRKEQHLPTLHESQHLKRLKSVCYFLIAQGRLGQAIEFVNTLPPGREREIVLFSTIKEPLMAHRPFAETIHLMNRIKDLDFVSQFGLLLSRLIGNTCVGLLRKNDLRGFLGIVNTLPGKWRAWAIWNTISTLLGQGRALFVIRTLIELCRKNPGPQYGILDGTLLDERSLLLLLTIDNLCCLKKYKEATEAMQKILPENIRNIAKEHIFKKEHSFLYKIMKKKTPPGVDLSDFLYEGRYTRGYGV